MKHQLLITLLTAAVLPMMGQSRGETPENVRQEMRMDKPLVTDEQTQHETLPLEETSTDSLVKVTTKYTHTYIDTIRDVRYSEDSIARIDTVVTYADSTNRKGHYVQAYIGGGYGSVGFKLDPAHGGKVTGFATGRVQAQYAYFFHKNFGVGAGVWFEHLGSTASLSNGMDYTDFVYNDRIDTEGESGYNHTARVYAWRERATLYNIAIPVSIQAQWWNEQGKAGIFGALGIAPTFAVAQKYRLVEGDVEHFGEYPNWGLTLDGMADHEYARNTDDPDLYTGKPTAQGTMHVTPMATIFAEFGALINLSKQVDLMVGVYGHFVPNSIVNETITSKFKPTDADEKAAPFGWGEGQRVGPSTFMDEYQGLYSTTLRVGTTNPWAVGLKVGVHWHHIAKPKTRTEQNYDYFFRADTTVRTVERVETEVVERIDTFQRAPKPEIKAVQKRVDRYNKIYFNFDSYVLNERSKKYLREIYLELKDLPNRMIVAGHSSEEGQVEYNEQLALRRATAVKNYLISLGIPEEQLEVQNFGARVANEENLQHEKSMDRRVEIVIVE